MNKLFLVLLVASLSAQEIKRPTTDTDSGNYGCFGTRDVSRIMTKAYDAAGLSTFASIVASGSMTGPRLQARLFSGWTAASSGYVALTLNVNSFSDGFISGGGGTACIKYSIDGGTSFTTLRCDTGPGWVQTTDTVILSPSQDLTKLRVGMCASGSKGNADRDPGEDDILAWDIWTSGTTNPQPAGNGSSAGQAHRGIVSVN